MLGKPSLSLYGSQQQSRSGELAIRDQRSAKLHGTNRADSLAASRFDTESWLPRGMPGSLGLHPKNRTRKAKGGQA